MQELAIYALSINPTTGAAERNWSTHGFLHNKTRNCLANERVEKLVYLFNNLRICDSINSEDAQYFNTDEVEEIDDGDGGIELTQSFCTTMDEEGDISQIVQASETAQEMPQKDNEAWFIIYDLSQETIQYTRYTVYYTDTGYTENFSNIPYIYIPKQDSTINNMKLLNTMDKQLTYRGISERKQTLITAYFRAPAA